LEQGVRFAYHDSIAAGWPLIHALERPRASGAVISLQAVLSSAVNVMLERVEAGATMEEALGEVVDRELTEPDPMLDTSGWDSAQKLTLLLTRLTGERYVGQEPEQLGLEGIDPVLVREAGSLDLRIKFVAMANLLEEPVATVRPMAVPRDGHLGLVRGENNVVVIEADPGGEMVYLGSGGGSLPVATAVLNDLVGVFDPGHSWTGRFPAAKTTLGAPRFESWLTVREGGVARVGEPGTGAVPILEPGPGTGGGS